ncbi:uncharacterized protein SPPG_00268 [Spizellomyces punctatus DAOM BR117]|uniref:Peptidase A1 domain-containing protein n=1 Tax=Spizellomyces punctatus (strain DAOM BR117) TaxID=645134 RepID=A0A0L0HTV9_SPIPD|nr:uncharacterized protein SPPG_00268 [Spizellomyces punctatus DAOM BR117]KND04543.1 hypothetical protein SPPG_00268 [Spizellomyces punctatus DAOM BR117]|eukprot:XP_016612582.1 hypothetical protein SPPG_00268 [Spizellomyces punctatus DAOM BR117]
MWMHLQQYALPLLGAAVAATLVGQNPAGADVLAGGSGDAPTGPAIIPMIRHPEGRLAFRRSLLRRSDDGLVTLKEDVTAEDIAKAMASLHFVEKNVTAGIPEAADDLIQNLRARDEGGTTDVDGDPDYIGEPDEDEMLQYYVGEEDEDEPPLNLRRRGMGESKSRRQYVAPSTPNVADISNNYDTMYYTSILVGTPGKWFSVVIDTGSADLWIPSMKCGSPCSQRRRYDATQSRTAYQLGIPVTTYYSLGSASGSVVTDYVRIGNLIATSQVFIQADQMNNVQPANVDGLLGLSFSSLSWANSVVPDNLVGKSSIIENLYYGRKLQQPAFGVWLDKYVSWSAAPGSTVGGELALGSTTGNPARYTGPITWLSVPNTANWWHVQLNGIAGPDGVNLVPSGRAIRGIVDTGTTLIVVDYAVAARLNGLLGAYGAGVRGLWAVSCNKAKNSGVKITFTLQGNKFTLDAADLPTRVWPDDPNTCYAPFQARQNQDVTDKWILGEVFLRKYYQIYDYNVQSNSLQPRVGLALAKH